MTDSLIFRTVWPVVMAGLLFSASVSARMPAIGDKAPDFTLRSNAGKNLKLSEYRGQVVMINFWATWCGPCREELPQLNRLYARYQRAGFVLLGLNIDDKPRAAWQVIDQLSLAFPVLFDTGKQVSGRYDVDAMPSTLLIDRGGVVRYVHRGYRGGVEDEYENRIRELLKQ